MALTKPGLGTPPRPLHHLQVIQLIVVIIIITATVLEPAAT